MHIGAALGTPTLAIFGSTSEVLTGPLGPKGEGGKGRYGLRSVL